MNIWQAITLVFLFVAMFVQDIAAKVAKKAAPVKHAAKKGQSSKKAKVVVEE